MTTGIDSSVSYLVLKQLQALSQRSGIAILCTIHQPSYKILELFDQLYILSRRGRAIYIGKPNLLRDHLLRYSLACPAGHNPADVVIELASTETRKECYPNHHTPKHKKQIRGLPASPSSLTTVHSPNHNHLVIPTATSSPSPSPLSMGSGGPIIHSDGSSSSGCFGCCSTISTIMINTVKGADHRDISPFVGSSNSSEIQKIETLEKVAEIECEEITERLLSPNMIEVRRLCSYQVPRTFCHIWFLFKRSFINSVLREQRWLLIRLLMHVLVAFVLSFLYDDRIGQADSCLDFSKGNDFENRTCSCPTKEQRMAGLTAENLASKNVAFLFFNLMFMMFAALMPTVLTFPAEMKVFLNEHRNGWYNTRSYYWAKSVVEFIVQLPLPYFYSLWMYIWTSQPGLDSIYDAIPFSQGSRFGKFVTMTILSSFIAQGVGFLIGAIFANNFNISIFVATVFMMFNFLFSGFFIRIAQMGDVEFLTRFSFTRFAFEAILIIIYGENRCKQPLLVTDAPNLLETVTEAYLAEGVYEDVTESAWIDGLPSLPTAVPLTMRAVGYSPLTNASSAFQPMEPSSTPAPSLDVISAILHQFDVKEEYYNRAIIWLLIHLIGWRIFTYLTLWWKVNPDSFHRKFFFPLFQLKKCAEKSAKKFICTLISFSIIFSITLTLLILYA